VGDQAAFNRVEDIHSSGTGMAYQCHSVHDRYAVETGLSGNIEHGDFAHVLRCAKSTREHNQKQRE
jgi:hypothetical protein